MSSFEDALSYVSRLSSNAFSIFVGAGLSMNCGMPDWNTLIEPYFRSLGIVDSNIPNTRIMQYALHSPAEYSLFLNQLKNSINDCKPLPVQRLIARLDLPRIWTTNYDGVLESAYSDEGMLFQVVAKNEDLFSLDFHKNQIIKMHGSLTAEKTTDIVLLESEYESYIYNRPDIYQLLRSDIMSKSFLYFGFSFDAPNLRAIIASVWNTKNTGIPSFLFTVPPSAL